MFGKNCVLVVETPKVPRFDTSKLTKVKTHHQLICYERLLIKVNEMLLKRRLSIFFESQKRRTSNEHLDFISDVSYQWKCSEIIPKRKTSVVIIWLNSSLNAYFALKNKHHEALVVNFTAIFWIAVKRAIAFIWKHYQMFKHAKHLCCGVCRII